jgi:hypothetical protein
LPDRQEEHAHRKEVNRLVNSQQSEEERKMFRRIVITVATLSLCSLPAFAATEYWVAKNASTNKCEIVSKKPDGKKLIEIGIIAHKNKKEAQAAMKSASECK